MPVAVAFSTIPDMFSGITRLFGNDSRPVLMYKTGGKYEGISYRELERRVHLLASGFASLGVSRGDRVGLISENRPEWVMTDLALVSLGAVGVPVYPTMTARQTEFIFNDAGVVAVVASNQFQLTKVLKIAADIPGLRHIITMLDRGPTLGPGVLTLQELMERGGDHAGRNPDHVRRAAAAVTPDDILTIIYTSGTTGNPKGVTLTHRNLATNIISSAQVIDIGPTDRLLSFLPLNHSFERMAGYYTAMACGGTIAYAESVDTVRDNMLEVQPTVLTTVPRLFERIHSRILRQVESGPPMKRRIFHWAVEVGRRYHQARKRGDLTPALRVQHTIADALVFSKLRARTGGRVRFFVSGGAALPREFGEFFEAVGLTIVEGYGLTETSPVLTVNRLDSYKFGSVGQAIPGVELTIAPDGEILARGPNIMQGYWNDPAATAEVIDRDGWFHTGDIGVMDSDGFVYITDRKKHLFVSSGGKNIAPQPIENLFLSSRYIDQFVLIGDRRMFLTALIVPDFDALREFASAQGMRESAPARLVALPAVRSLIDGEIQSLQRDLASFERVRKFTLLERPFTIEEGELTPSQKIRRKVVEEKYAHLIEGMYQGIT
jgi:long-chain acyl-CoA synthetase